MGEKRKHTISAVTAVSAAAMASVLGGSAIGAVDAAAGVPTIKSSSFDKTPSVFYKIQADLTKIMIKLDTTLLKIDQFFLKGQKGPNS